MNDYDRLAIAIADSYMDDNPNLPGDVALERADYLLLRTLSTELVQRLKNA